MVVSRCFKRTRILLCLCLSRAWQFQFRLEDVSDTTFRLCMVTCRIPSMAALSTYFGRCRAWGQVMLVSSMASAFKPHQWEGLQFLWETIVTDFQVGTRLFASGFIARVCFCFFPPPFFLPFFWGGGLSNKGLLGLKCGPLHITCITLDVRAF